MHNSIILTTSLFHAILVEHHDRLSLSNSNVRGPCNSTRFIVVIQYENWRASVWLHDVKDSLHILVVTQSWMDVVTARRHFHMCCRDDTCRHHLHPVMLALHVSNIPSAWFPASVCFEVLCVHGQVVCMFCSRRHLPVWEVPVIPTMHALMRTWML
jgi:hypothetical protein